MKNRWEYRNDPFPRWSSIGIGIGVVWTILLVLSISWNIVLIKENISEIALNHAQTVFEKDLVYRSWSAQYGGVYIPVSSGIEPNPYLEFLPERDIVSSAGEVYTLVNPAYMTRLVNKLQTERGLVVGHITSLNPINPLNIADVWETKALTQFEEGAVQVSAIEFIEQVEYMRLMRPLYVEEACLKCHEHQGYGIGDIRGGISVSVPMAELRKVEQSQIQSLVHAYLLIWVSGLFIFGLGVRRLFKKDTLLIMDLFLGCFNRHYFFQTLELEVERAVRYHSPLALMMVDIDNFKRVNDTYGHMAGDEILKQFVIFIQSELRKPDIFARYGGDEFCVLLPETSIEEATALAERLREGIENYVFKTNELKIIISSSFGVTAILEREDIRSDLLIKEADQALYRAKGMGKNQVSAWSIRRNSDRQN